MVDENSPQFMVGGAIVSTSSNVTVIKCKLKGNGAEVGGAIFSELQSNFVIINTTFRGNYAIRCFNVCTRMMQ